MRIGFGGGEATCIDTRATSAIAVSWRSLAETGFKICSGRSLRFTSPVGQMSVYQANSNTPSAGARAMAARQFDQPNGSCADVGLPFDEDRVGDCFG